MSRIVSAKTKRQGKEAVHLPPPVEPVPLPGSRGGITTPSTLLNSREKGGRKMPTRSMDGISP